MIDADTNLAMAMHGSTLDGEPADIDDPDPAEIDRLIASLDDLADLNRSRALVEPALYSGAS
ncbi:MAG TPA: hypothetical protein VKT99_20685 [Xanthobacteraceae bacterium]|jgi:hypothetical protein|nr:hypothetical protein [Xanthobacteraceae bacterium]